MVVPIGGRQVDEQTSDVYTAMRRLLLLLLITMN